MNQSTHPSSADHTSLRAAVVGVGHLGRHHARILAGLPGVRLVAVADTRLDQAKAVAEPLAARAVADYRELIGQVDLVSIAVPTAFHRQVAAPFLQAGVHALVEKPLAPAASDAEELVALAKQSAAILHVGHIERYNPVWNEARPAAPKYISAERQGLFTGRSTDIGVVLDLMIHDIDLVLSLIPAPVIAVSALGLSLFGPHEDIASARIWFEDGAIADLTASRASMNPARRMKIWNHEGYTALDFASRQGKRIRLKAATEPPQSHLIDLSGLDFSQPARVKERIFGELLQVDELATHESREQLALELGDFVDAIRYRRQPLVPGEDGLRAVRLAEQIIASLRSHRWDGAHDQSRVGPNLRADLPADRHAVPPEPHLRRAGAPRAAAPQIRSQLPPTRD
jgi:predicted dehydrogenase